jgi:AcrR family transcriptional regulator
MGYSPQVWNSWRRPCTADRAAACYGRGGHGAMTIHQVCAQANASVGTVFHHFPRGLREIEDALYLDTLRLFQRGFLSELGRHRSAAAGVRSSIVFHLDWMAGNIPLAQYVLAFNASWLSPAHLAQLEEMVRLRVLDDPRLKSSYDGRSSRPCPLQQSTITALRRSCLQRRATSMAALIACAASGAGG